MWFRYAKMQSELTHKQSKMTLVLWAIAQQFVLLPKHMGNYDTKEIDGRHSQGTTKGY